MSERMKVMVTGSAGFIGSALTMRLLERGDEVGGVDNLNDYYDPPLKLARLARHIDHPRNAHVTVDLADRAAMERAFATHAPQRVDRVPSPDPQWSGDAPDPASSHAPYRIYNIGNENAVNLLEYVRILEKRLQRQAIIEYLPMQAGDVPDTEADVSELLRAVDCRPKVSVEQGIDRFVRWYLDHYGDNPLMHGRAESGATSPAGP